MTDPGRPAPGEYAEYYGTYVDEIADGAILDTLERQIGGTLALLRAVPEERGMHRYAPGKWSVKEVVGHVVDAERIFAGRALHFARCEEQPLPGMDQDAYVAAAGFDRRPLADLVDELEAVRRASLALFAGLGPDDWMRTGVASGCTFTVRSIPWILAGHERHHVGVLRTRYLR